MPLTNLVIDENGTLYRWDAGASDYVPLTLSEVPIPSGIARAANVPSMVHTHGGGGGAAPVVKLKTSDQNHSATSYADVTDLTWPVALGKKYWLHATLGFRAAATTTGIGFAVNGPAAPTTLSVLQQIIGARSAATAGAFASDHTASYDAGTTSTAVQAAATNYNAMLDCYIEPSVGGILAVRVRAEVGAQVTVNANSFGVLTEVS